MTEGASAAADKYADYSREQLLAEISRLKKSKKYGLVWEHKVEDVIQNFETWQPYLEEVAEKRIENAPDEPTNLIIEGDNFEALSVLNYTHAGKVDVIYIDPPYNTGNKDFIYNDNYVDSEDAFRHSKWLSFMEPRLKLAKNLLKDDGVIFISIDDNEQAALSLLCDSIFGRDNRLGGAGNIIWLKRNSDTASDNLAKNHEYVIAYQRSCEVDVGVNEIVREKAFKNDDGFYIDKGEILGFGMLNLNNRPNLGYSFYYNESKNDLIAKADQNVDVARSSNEYAEIYSDDEDLKSKGYIIIRPKKVRGQIKCWGSSLDTVTNNIQDYFVVKKNGNYFIHKKIKVDDEYVKKDGNNYYLEKSKRYPLNSVIENVSSKNGIDDLYNSLGKKSFNNPKPVELLNCLIKPFPKNAIVLDFFAGSGTTGQAVLELNKEDGGHRQFILCTNNGDKGPDSTKIAEEITYPRVKTVITGVRQDGSKYSDGIPANLRYYKIDHREKKQSLDANRQDFAYYIDDIIQVKENAFKQIVTEEDYALYAAKDKYVATVTEPFALEEIMKRIAEINTDKLPLKLYVFSYSRDAFEENFDVDFDIEFAAMPEGLLKTYANIVAEQKKEDL